MKWNVVATMRSAYMNHMVETIHQNNEWYDIEYDIYIYIERNLTST